MIKVIGKENCNICEMAYNFLIDKGLAFEYSKIEDYSPDESKLIKQKAIQHKIMSFPLMIVDEKYMTFDRFKNIYSNKIIKRNGTTVPFDKNKIIAAIERAMFEVNDLDNDIPNQVAKAIERKALNVSTELTVEEIQLLVEQELKAIDSELYQRYKNYRILKDKERKIKSKIQPKNRLLSDEFISKYKHIKNPMTPLGEFTYYRTYSRWIEELNRREYWWETVQRVVEYNCSLLPTSKEEAESLYDNIFNLRQFPSGRSLWIAGTKSSEDYPLSNYNCSFVVIDSFKKYKELFHALLVGAGVGFRVLQEDVSQLPPVRNDVEIIHKPYKPVTKKNRNEYTSIKFKDDKVEVIVGDSKNGWYSALDYMLDFISNKDFKYVKTIIFNYNHVRPYGERLKTFGGFSSGHSSLKRMLEKIYSIIDNRVNNNETQLKPIDCMDIANIIAENVVVGGVRRSAEICLFGADDQEILTAKNNLYIQEDGKWVTNQDIIHRKMSNNSIVYYKKPTRDKLHWQIEQMRYSGEPAFINMESALKRNPNAKGVNPCSEIILDDRQSCNLTVVNMMAFVDDNGCIDYESLYNAQRLSSRMAYRMTAVDIEMHDWKIIQHRDRLLGCDLTGQQDFINATNINISDFKELMKKLKEIARIAADEIADENKLNKSLLVTAGKPNGTLALLPTVSAGCHYSHSPYYVRRIRISSNDPLCSVIEELSYPMYPENGQEWATCDTKVVEFPVKSPVGKTKYDVSAIEQLEYYKMMMDVYVDMNQSITVHVRNNEWEDVEQWMWDNWDSVVGISFLSLDDSFYPLLPYEAITKEEYEQRLSDMKPFKPDLISKYEKVEFEGEGVEDAECKGGCGVR